MAIALQERPRVIFKKNPLKVVVAQLRFPPIYALDQPAGVVDFQEAIRHLFPVAETRAHEVSVTVAPDSGASTTSRPGPWRFLSEDGDYVAAITPDFLNLETTRYTRFEVFQDRFRALLDAASATLPITRRTRLGLRYVDEITHPDARKVTDWRRFLRNELLGIAAGELLADQVTQTLEQINVTLDGARMTIRHGYFARDESSVYVIDLDAYDETIEVSDTDKTIDDLRKFKKWAWSFFIQSVTDEMVRYLEPEDLV